MLWSRDEVWDWALAASSLFAIDVNMTNKSFGSALELRLFLTVVSGGEKLRSHRLQVSEERVRSRAEGGRQAGGCSSGGIGNRASASCSPTPGSRALTRGQVSRHHS